MRRTNTYLAGIASLGALLSGCDRDSDLSRLSSDLDTEKVVDEREIKVLDESVVFSQKYIDHDIITRLGTELPLEIDEHDSGIAPTFYRTLLGKIVFSDNMAFGMKAFIIYNGKEQELKRDFEDKESAYFGVPLEFFLRNENSLIHTNREFDYSNEIKVYAADRDGNKSQPVTLYASVRDNSRFLGKESE